MNLLISVIIPLFNTEKYILEALHSIQTQDYSPIEIIVVDDGSIDGSIDQVQSNPAVRLYRQFHQGPGHARNTGILNSRGDWFAFLDADDVWMPDKLSAQSRYLAAHPDLDMVFGQIEQFISPEIPTGQHPFLPDNRHVMNGLHIGAMLIKRESFNRVGLFRTDLKIGEFIAWYARAQELELKSSILNQIVMRRRIHRDNLTYRERQSQTDYLQVIKAALDRRRATK